MSGADKNFVVLDLDATASTGDAGQRAGPPPDAGQNNDSTCRHQTLASGEEVVVAAEDPDLLPPWLSRSYLVLSLVTSILCISVAVLASLAARRLYVHAYVVGSRNDAESPTKPVVGPEKPEGPRPIEPRRRDILLSFLVYCPCVVAAYALLTTVGIPAFSAVRVKGQFNFTPSVQGQLKSLRNANLVWLGMLALCMAAATVAFFLSPGDQWPPACGVAPLLATVATLGLMALTWKM